MLPRRSPADNSFRKSFGSLAKLAVKLVHFAQLRTKRVARQLRSSACDSRSSWLEGLSCETSESFARLSASTGRPADRGICPGRVRTRLRQQRASSRRLDLLRWHSPHRTLVGWPRARLLRSRTRPSIPPIQLKETVILQRIYGRLSSMPTKHHEDANDHGLLLDLPASLRDTVHRPPRL